MIHNDDADFHKSTPRFAAEVGNRPEAIGKESGDPVIARDLVI
jgi:hypothetical protein